MTIIVNGMSRHDRRVLDAARKAGVEVDIIDVHKNERIDDDGLWLKVKEFPAAIACDLLVQGVMDVLLLLGVVARFKPEPTASTISGDG